MIKEIDPDRLNNAMKEAYDNWQNFFVDSVLSMGFNGIKDYEGEDKNMLALKAKPDFVRWFAQSPGKPQESYRDDGFYVRELTWLSLWCNPKIVVEFGTDKGLGTFILSRVNPQATVHTVDIEPNTGQFARDNDVNMVFHVENSKHFNMPDTDLCFIDGDHSQQSVWEDSLRAWENRNKNGRWVIIWHDFKDEDSCRGLKMAVNRFSDLVRKKVYKFSDSSTVWMTNEN